MDNLVRPDNNIAISRPHNLNEANNRLEGLKGVFQRLIESSEEVFFDETDDKDNENNIPEFPAPRSPKPKPDAPDETGETLEGLRGELNRIDSSFPSKLLFSDDKIDKERENNIAVPSSPTIIIPPTETEGKEQVKNNDYAFLSLLDDIDIPDFDPEKLGNESQMNSKSQVAHSTKITSVPPSGDEFAVFDLSELITETPEQCFDFASMHTDNPYLELDFDVIMKDASLKSADISDTVLQDKNVNLKSEKITSDVEMQSPDSFSMLNASTNASIDLDKEKVFASNYLDSKSDKIHSDVEMVENVFISNVLNDSCTGKSTDLKDTKLEDKIKLNKIPSGGEMTSEDYFTMFIGSGSSTIKSTYLDEGQILLDNDVNSKSDKIDVEVTENASNSGSSSTGKSTDLRDTMVQDKTLNLKSKKIPSDVEMSEISFITSKMNGSSFKKSQRSKNTCISNEASEKVISKGRLTFSKDYTVKYSDKMAKFLGLDLETKPKDKDETYLLSTKTDTDTKSDNNVEGRRRCTLNKKKYFEGYEKKPPRQDPEIQKRNQYLMESYHASLIDYATEMKMFEEPPQPDSCSVPANTNSICIDLTGDNPSSSQSSSSKQHTTKQFPTEFVDGGKEEGGKCKKQKTNFKPVRVPELGKTKQKASKPKKVEEDKATFDSDRIARLLEEKYKAMTFTENTAKILNSVPKPEGCQLPCFSRLMSALNMNKTTTLSTPVCVTERLNCELRRSAQEKLNEQTEIDIAKYGENENIFVNKKKDMIISVEFYHPVEKEYLASDQKRTRGQPKIAMELQALSSNSLEELCNNFLCSNDYIGLKELPHPKYYSPSDLMNKDAAFEMLPTATMLINDTVYCFQDERKGANTGRIIQEWENSKLAKGIGPLKYADLATTLLNDLTIQFGYPYVYVHLGSCEHIVIFTQARLINPPTDNLYAHSYPIIKNHINFENIYCKTHKYDEKLQNIKGRSTSQYLARYAVVDSDRFPDNPTLLCRFCVDKFCYDKKGKKMGSFKLYPFMQVASVVKDK